MTITSSPPRSTALDGPHAGRRTMVTLAVIYLGFFAFLMASGADREPDANPAKLIADYDISATVIQIVTYSTVVAGAVLVFFGAALRSALTLRTRRWTADVAFLGFVLMALTLVTWAISALALYHAVDIGDTERRQGDQRHRHHELPAGDAVHDVRDDRGRCHRTA